jgi:hypothetical protein
LVVSAPPIDPLAEQLRNISNGVVSKISNPRWRQQADMALTSPIAAKP